MKAFLGFLTGHFSSSTAYALEGAGAAAFF
jgi:hypothetical protein